MMRAPPRLSDSRVARSRARRMAALSKNVALTWALIMVHPASWPTCLPAGRSSGRSLTGRRTARLASGDGLSHRATATMTASPTPKAHASRLAALSGIGAVVTGAFARKAAFAHRLRFRVSFPHQTDGGNQKCSQDARIIAPVPTCSAWW